MINKYIKSDPIPWLIEEKNPAVRYHTKNEILKNQDHEEIYKELINSDLTDFFKKNYSNNVLGDSKNTDIFYRGSIMPALHILSPFDGLVTQRRWLADLFSFDFRLECYTPADKRKYGYFMLPLLWGERFVGRLDAKADRARKTLLVRSVVYEEGCEGDTALRAALDERLVQFAAFCGCEQVVWGNGNGNGDAIEEG